MPDNKVSTEVIRRVYDDSEGVFIEVGPFEEGGAVEIRTVDKTSREWFGELRLALNPSIAKALGHALIATAEEQENG